MKPNAHKTFWQKLDTCWLCIHTSIKTSIGICGLIVYLQLSSLSDKLKLQPPQSSHTMGSVRSKTKWKATTLVLSSYSSVQSAVPTNIIPSTHASLSNTFSQLDLLSSRPIGGSLEIFIQTLFWCQSNSLWSKESNTFGTYLQIYMVVSGT